MGEHMKRYPIYFTLALITLIGAFSGCGGTGAGVSAPPVDLPAPVTGRVDVSAPDADGNVHITGAAGAVPGGSMIMAVNESVAGAVAWKILDRLIPSAYAQEVNLPSVCGLPGHACTVAADDGSFEILLPAVLDDAIAIGIIDPETGEFLSDLLRLIVALISSPGGPNATAHCAGLNLSGAAADLAIAPTTGELVVLKQGSETATNTLVIGISGATTIPIDGCFAHSLALVEGPTGNQVAVTSKDDKILWTGTLANGQVTGAQSFTLDAEPMHIVFADTMDPLIATTSQGSLTLARYSLATGLPIVSIKPMMTNGVEIPGLIRSVRIDLKNMTNSTGGMLGLLVSDTGTSTSAVVTFFDAQDLRHFGSFEIASLNSDPNTKDPVKSIVDASLYAKEDLGGLAKYMKFALLDSGDTTVANGLMLFRIYKDAQTPLANDDDLATINPLTKPFLIKVLDPTSGQPLLALGTIGSHALTHLLITEATNSFPMAIVVNEMGQLFSQHLAEPITVNTTPASSLTANHPIGAIVIDTTGPKLFALDLTDGNIVDGTALIP